MSRQHPRHVALRQAQRAGCPYTYVSGGVVVLVLSAALDPKTNQVNGRVAHYTCSSAGLARAIAARVLGDLELFPALGERIFEYSEKCVLAARSCAAEAQGG